MGIRYTWLVLAGMLFGSSGQNAVWAEPGKGQVASKSVVSTFVPVNGQAFRMRQPDGIVRMFVRDEEEPNLLHGENGWVAELDGRKTLVMKEADSADGQMGFLFIDGYLRKQLSGGRESNVSLPPPGNDNGTITALWPDKSHRLVAAQAPDVWGDGSRLRLWFDNPNKAGLLFAELAIAFLALAFCRPFWVRIAGCALSLAAFVGLVQTSSRGAFLGFLCGIALMGLTRLKSLFTLKRMMMVAVVIVVAAICLFVSGQADRMGKNLLNEGQRETSRLIVWREVPHMMVDAPCGWGYGQSARAYIDWYQQKSECLLKDLISGHLTFLVESGWGVRVAYVFLWLMVMLVAFMQALRGASPVPIAILAAFAVAACFNPVVSVLELWIVPFFAVMEVVTVQFGNGVRRAEFRGLGMKALLSCAVGTALITGLAVGVVFVMAAKMPTEVSVAKEGRAVYLNGKSPAVWMVDDDYVLHGGYWWLEGKCIRDYFAAHDRASPLGFVRSVADLPADVEKLVLVGESGREFLSLDKRPSAKRIVFISPPFTWNEIPAGLRAAGEVEFIAGEQAMRFACGGQKPPEWVRLVSGAELYVSNWIEFVL